MVVGPDFCRDMRAVEEPAVDALLRAAFGGEAEVRLVHALRKSGKMMGEMVLPYEGGVVGYAALSQLTAPKGWLALAPVAIADHMRGRRNGQRMVGLITEWARITQTPIVVVGPVQFYERAGFSRANAQGLETPYPLERTLIAGVEGIPVERLIYPNAFKDL
ncbi:putative acetyltransferase [Cognatiyoonia koreensis]|uniref:Putative acetyltransferase n=1 Tax=Cognatiyoonia koreensis TaxID=364200 RepID=A0A1I0N086_9RHOB|nr:N-acetyltransferase [Cognatiyoonia koreensis]SEV94211.1 putative acetyltransferase [Cognatiyoonia koreensis]